MKIIYLFISIFFTQILVAQTRKYSNEFLNIGVDAAAMGMANAVTSTVSDVTAGYWNPAGLSGIKDVQGSLMHAAYFANIAQYDYIGVAMPFQEKNVLGVSLIRFGVDDILDTTQLIDSQGNVNFQNINLFSAADYALQFSFARNKVWKNVDMGANAKIIHRRIGKFATSYGFGFDAGLQINREKWHYGLMLRDITTTFNTWSIDNNRFSLIQDAIPGENQELPETTEITLPKVQLGVAKDWQLSENIGLQTALDFNVRFAKTNDYFNSDFVSLEPAFGFNVNYLDFVFLRGGVNNLQEELQFDNSKNITWQPNLGVGFNYHGIQVDYALTNIASVGNALYSNIFSLKVDFEAFRK